MELKSSKGSKTKVVVFGAGEGGLLLKRTLDRDRNSALEVVAFFDDNQQKVGKKLEGYLKQAKRPEKVHNHTSAHQHINLNNIKNIIL